MRTAKVQVWCLSVRFGAFRAFQTMSTAANRVKRLKNSKVLVKFSMRGTPLARRVPVSFGCLWLLLVTLPTINAQPLTTEHTDFIPVCSRPFHFR
jgi:hypothetical protein